MADIPGIHYLYTLWWEAAGELRPDIPSIHYLREIGGLKLSIPGKPCSRHV